MKKVAYQGAVGAYSAIAAQKFFGANESLELVGHKTFTDALQAAYVKRCDYAILPIENSTTGFIQSYPQDNFSEVGQIVLLIEHCLLVRPGTQLFQITNVYSHPQALAQCSHFLSLYPHIKPNSFEDTALAAQKISIEKNPTHAAIASDQAGNLYGLKILKRDIADKPNNKTRFVILQRRVSL